MKTLASISLNSTIYLCDLLSRATRDCLLQLFPGTQVVFPSQYPFEGSAFFFLCRLQDVLLNGLPHKRAHGTPFGLSHLLQPVVFRRLKQHFDSLLQHDDVPGLLSVCLRISYAERANASISPLQTQCARLLTAS